MSGTVHFEKSLLLSRAYSQLNGSAIRVLNHFYMKRRMKKTKSTPGRSDSWMITNNGDIVFTRDEAKKNGFKESTFKRAIDDLIEFGFIDLEHQGTGLRGDCSLYSVSKRWRLYGEPGFVVKKRQKQLRDTKALQAGRIKAMVKDDR